MGIYETYGKTQLKINNDFKDFKIGDKASIPNGVYVGLEGIVVIIKGRFVGEFNYLKSKWGDIITPDEIINEYHPFKDLIMKGKKTK